MIKVDSISAIPRENWFAVCIASVDAALSRNGLAFASTTDVDHQWDLIPVIAVKRPLVSALGEYRHAESPYARSKAIDQHFSTSKLI